MQRVFEPFSHEQTDACSFSFQHRVRCDGGAVKDQRDIGRGNAGLFADQLDADGHADRLVLRGRRRFGLVSSLRFLIVQQQVGEGAPDIDAKSHFAIPPAIRRKIASWSTWAHY